MSDYGFVLGISTTKNVNFSDTKDIFSLIRKYIKLRENKLNRILKQ